VDAIGPLLALFRQVFVDVMEPLVQVLHLSLQPGKFMARNIIRVPFGYYWLGHGWRGRRILPRHRLPE
jgi:hypothetical protein